MPACQPDQPPFGAEFPRNLRLLTQHDFNQVFARAKPFKTRFFTLLVRPNDLHVARLGLVVGKKKLKRAVDRNQIKRLARESFRRARPGLPGVDIVLIAKPIAALDKRQIFAKLEQQWAKIREFYE